MSIKWIKSLVISIIGIVLISIGLHYYLFRTLDLSFSQSGRYELQLDRDKIITQDLELQQDLYTSKTSDAWLQVNLPVKQMIKQIEMEIDSIDVKEKSQIYYTNSKSFHSSKYIEASLQPGKNVIELNSQSPVRSLRFDITSNPGESFTVKSIKVIIPQSIIVEYFLSCIIFSIIYLLIIFIIINRAYLSRKITTNIKYKQKYQLVDQVISLSVSDFKNRFSGSYLGICWGILQPLSTILLFWFVFQIGFRSQPIEDVPFILWLAAGMIPWNYFYDSWFSGTAAFTSYNYIVKKVVFNIELLPLVKVISSCILNLIFNAILLFIYVIYGEFPGLHILDMVYYSFCLFALTLGLSYITATLNVFMKDIGQFLGIVLQFLMWMTPMMWVYTTIPEQYSWFYKLNPLHYIINGYRESLINGYWFYHNYKMMIWFWFVTICCIFIGRKLMRKLKSHFADVL